MVSASATSYKGLLRLPQHANVCTYESIGSDMLLVCWMRTDDVSSGRNVSTSELRLTLLQKLSCTR